ncbi:hypothetical protein [Wolbachia endosymbiont (group E) of Neria commutata]|uniref:hypothetical protein n=1 Tax=Wolbachia endosymbiont (group E) of Neria commutata TaxID=3066149 RepID=UPI003132D87F
MSQNVRILEDSGLSLVKTLLTNLRCIEKNLQEARESGKANRETGLFNRLYNTSKDFWNEKIKGEKYAPNTKEQHEKVYKILHEALEIIYLAMSTSDDRVIIDYAREMESKIKKESNSDIADIYSVLYSIFKEYKVSKRKGDSTSDINKWERLWYNFQGILQTYQDNVHEDKLVGHLRMALYASELASKKYEEHQRQRFTKEFRNIDVKILPGNCLINWLGATYGGVQRANDMETEQAKQKTEHEARGRREAEQGKREAEQRVKVTKSFGRLLRRTGFDDELYDIVKDNEDNIVEAVVEHVMKHNSSAEQVLNAIIEEIKFNRTQVIEEGTVNAELIKVGIESSLNQGSSLSNVAVNQGASAGIGRH